MPTGYMLNWSDNTLKPPFLLPDATVDNHTTSLQLTGKRVVNWGEFLNENMLHLLEHGFSKTAPNNPTIGQLWLDANSGDLKIFTSQLTWNVIVNVPGIGTQTTTPTPLPITSTTSTSTSTSTSTTPSINLPPDMTNFVHTIPTTMVEGTSANVSFSGAVDPEGGTVTYELISLPAAVYASKTTNISSGEIITLTVDQNATGGAEIYAYGITIRAVDPQNLYSSTVVVLRVTSANVVPTVIGTPWQGGYYYGRINSGPDIYGLVMSPKAAGEASDVTWSEAMAFCDNLTINNFSDWVCPSKDELEIAYRYLKPIIRDNALNSGANANSIPPSSDYTLTDPAQTTVSSFQSGGSEALDKFGTEGNYQYWSSIFAGRQNVYFMQSFFNGFQGGDNTLYSVNAVRAIRRVKIN